MQQPHGGRLVNRVGERKEGFENLEKVWVSDALARDVENIAYGVFSPLEGFLCKNDYDNVLINKRLSNDIPWTIPIVLDVDKEEIVGLEEGDELVLQNKNGLFAVMKIEEIYGYNKKELAREVFGTLEKGHPGVRKVYEMKDLLIGGKITLINPSSNPFEKYLLKPMETRILFKEKGWKKIAAFQTRNPPHLGHEYVQKTALTFVDGIFINPISGEKKEGDFIDEVILDAYEALIKNYYSKDRAVMSILATEMRYAGPREAIFHAIMRKNFGCTHFIIGRDHAGVGNYYPPYAAHDIFDEFPDLGITPLFFKSFFFCKKCGGVVNEKICPHGEKDHINFSGTKIREMLRNGKRPPSEMMRKEVADAILSHQKLFVEK
jgi:sulfate adenylyltransferase